MRRVLLALVVVSFTSFHLFAADDDFRTVDTAISAKVQTGTAPIPTTVPAYQGAVPYPSPANNSFTPITIPSSRSPKGGGLPVHITNIKRQPDGRVSFQIGYEYE
jgi:hypothetical protein